MESRFNVIPSQILAPVVSNEQVMPGVHLLWLEAPEMARVASPGQFAMLRCEGNAFLRRPLSIHRLNNGKTQLAFLFSAVGKGTHWLSELNPGRCIDVLGPLGKGFTINPASQNLLLIAGGMGIAPLGFLAETAISRGKSVSLLLGASTASLICPEQLLPANVTCLLTTEDGSCGRQGYVTRCLPEALPKTDQIYACGPTPMFRALAGDIALRDKDVQVSLEIRMACGLGICYGCTVNTRQGAMQVCKHGPVFRLCDIIWEEMTDI
jgi:dihydroorotate dehydrogenase electron transfer subunit